MIRISFRQGLLAGFAMIVLLLGGASLGGWLVVEHFVGQSRENGEQALQAAASIQELGERTVDVARSARQFLVLQEPDIRQRFDDHLAQALAVVDRLDALDAKPLRSLLGDWREWSEVLRRGLDRGTPAAELTPVMDRLTEINGLLKGAGQHWIDIRNSALLAELEASRLRLGGQLALALAGALLVVLAVGWWLVRPLRNLERAIERLGEKRFDQPVVVGGPADFRQLGRQLDWLRQRLAELEDDRERTLRHVSHELKTPLTALREGVALLQDEVPGTLDATQREVVAILQNNVIALQRQIEGLLSLNAAAFESSRLIRRPVGMRDFLADAVRRRELHSQARQLTLRIEAPDLQVSVDDEAGRDRRQPAVERHRFQPCRRRNPLAGHRRRRQPAPRVHRSGAGRGRGGQGADFRTLRPGLEKGSGAAAGERRRTIDRPRAGACHGRSCLHAAERSRRPFFRGNT